MKNLKIKFGLFSLLAILAASVFLTSCEQEMVLPDTTEETTLFDSSKIFTLSEDFDNMSDEELNDYFENLTNEERANLVIGEVESRGSCGNWSYYCCRCYRRWCGPPGNGGYEYWCF